MKIFFIVLLLITFKYGIAYKKYPDINGVQVVIKVDINDHISMFEDTPMYFEINKPYTTKNLEYTEGYFEIQIKDDIKNIFCRRWYHPNATKVIYYGHGTCDHSFGINMHGMLHECDERNQTIVACDWLGHGYTDGVDKRKGVMDPVGDSYILKRMLSSMCNFIENQDQCKHVVYIGHSYGVSQGLYSMIKHNLYFDKFIGIAPGFLYIDRLSLSIAKVFNKFNLYDTMINWQNGMSVLSKLPNKYYLDDDLMRRTLSSRSILGQVDITNYILKQDEIKNSENIYFVYSKNDPTIPEKNIEKFIKKHNIYSKTLSDFGLDEYKTHNPQVDSRTHKKTLEYIFNVI